VHARGLGVRDGAREGARVNAAKWSVGPRGVGCDVGGGSAATAHHPHPCSLQAVAAAAAAAAAADAALASAVDATQETGGHFREGAEWPRPLRQRAGGGV